MARNLLATVSAPKSTRPGKIDFDREHDNTLDRFMASSKMTPEGQASYYEARGFKVATAGDGRLFLQDPNDGTWYPVDKSGSDVKSTINDIADLGGDIMQSLPSLAAGPNILGQGAAGVVGNAIRQGASALTPGDDQMSMQDRAGSMALDATIGAGVQGTMALAGKMSPTNYIGKRLGAMADTPYAQESARLEDAAGLTFLPGQKTGSKALQMMEAVLRRAPGSADKMFAHETGQLTRGLEFFDMTLERLFGPAASKSGVGKAAVRGYSTAIDAAHKIRGKARDADLQRLTAASKNRPMFDLDNTRGAISRLITELEVPAGTAGDAIPASLARLKKLHAAFANKPATPMEMQRYLSIYGKASRGKTALWDGVDKTQQQGTAGVIFRSLQDDLSQAADAATGDGRSAVLLKTFRDNWRAHSEAIDEVKESALGRFINRGGADDQTAEKILRLSGDELTETLTILNKIDAGAAAQVKRLHFTEAFSKAGVPASDAAEEIFTAAARGPKDGGIDWSPRVLLTTLKKSPIWGALPAVERANIRDAVQVLGRLAKREGEGSPTAPLRWAKDIMDGAARFSAAPFLFLMGARKLAEIVTTKEGQVMLGNLFKRPRDAKFKRAALNLVALSNTDGHAAPRNVRPDGDLQQPRAGRNLLQ